MSGDGFEALWCAGIAARRYPIGSRSGNCRVVPYQASPRTPPIHKNRFASGMRRGTDKKNAGKDAREPGWNPRHRNPVRANAWSLVPRPGWEATQDWLDQAGLSGTLGLPASSSAPRFRPTIFTNWESSSSHPRTSRSLNPIVPCLRGRRRSQHESLMTDHCAPTHARGAQRAS